MERAGQQGPTTFFQQHTEFHKRIARAAIWLGKHQTRPAQLRHLLPQLWTIPRGIVFHSAHVRRRALLAQEVPGAILEELLLFVQTEVHALLPRLPGETQTALSDDVA